MEKNTKNKEEIEKFESLAQDWWKDEGKFASLHAINPIRIEYILKNIENSFDNRKDIKIIDVGCGGGIATMPFARLGFDITAIDPGFENIKIAKQYADSHHLNIKFFNETAEEHLNHQIKYDVIICLEMIEHVNNVEILIESLYKLLNPGGIIIISTINRTLKAKLLAIGIAEYILNILPINTHDFNKFVKPSEISRYFEQYDLKITEIKGISFDFTKMKWVLSDNIDINYLCKIEYTKKT